jgi:hypothetical protein
MWMALISPRQDWRRPRKKAVNELARLNPALTRDQVTGPSYSRFTWRHATPSVPPARGTPNAAAWRRRRAEK